MRVSNVMKRFVIPIGLLVSLLSPVLAQAPTEERVRVSIEAPAEMARGQEYTVTVRFVIKKGMHIYAAHRQDVPSTPTVVEPMPVKGWTYGAVKYPDPIRRDYKALGGDVELYEGTMTATVPVKVEAAAPTGEADISFKVSYAACTDRICYKPEIGKVFTGRVRITGTSESHPPSDNLKVLKEVPAAPTRRVSKEESLVQDYLGRGILVALFFIFLAGIATSLTPCVLPMVPITVAYFRLQSGPGRWGRFRLALVYVVGIAVTFSSLGLIASLAQVPFGTVQGNPYIMIPIVLCFAALGLSMFGLYEIRVPQALMNKLGSGKKGYLGALTMGLVLGLVAAPCVGPVLLGILAVVSTLQDPVLGFAMLFSFAMGIGVLFIVLALFSVSLPKSGPWMEAVKDVFGVMLFTAALFYARTFVSDAVLAVLAGLVLIAWGVLLWRRWKPRVAPLMFAAICLAVGGALVGGSGTFGVGIVESLLGGRGVELKMVKERLANAKELGRPVVLDFSASWCIGCIEVDTMLHQPELQKVLERFTVIKVDVSISGGPEEKFMSGELGLPGVPSLAFYDSQGRYLKDSAISGVPDRNELVELLKKVP